MKLQPLTLSFQCRLPVSDACSSLCSRHRAEQQQTEAADCYGHLTKNYHDFQTAQGINHSLHNLYDLLAQNRISALVPPFSLTSAACFSAPCRKLTPTTPPESSSGPKT